MLQGAQRRLARFRRPHNWRAHAATARPPACPPARTHCAAALARAPLLHGPGAVLGGTARVLLQLCSGPWPIAAHVNRSRACSAPRRTLATSFTDNSLLLQWPQLPATSRSVPAAACQGVSINMQCAARAAPPQHFRTPGIAPNPRPNPRAPSSHIASTTACAGALNRDARPKAVHAPSARLLGAHKQLALPSRVSGRAGPSDMCQSVSGTQCKQRSQITRAMRANSVVLSLLLPNGLTHSFRQLLFRSGHPKHHGMPLTRTSRGAHGSTSLTADCVPCSLLPLVGTYTCSSALMAAACGACLPAACARSHTD